MDSKKNKLLEFIDEITKENSLLAYSGGADSALLLFLMNAATLKNKTRFSAVYIETELSPSKDKTQATRFADEVGVEIDFLKINEWESEEIVENSKKRCYYCKKHLFSCLTDVARKQEAKTVVDGTNWDDLQCYRPGHLAAQEFGIVSPLALCGITKKEVRSYLSQYDLSVAQRPSSPCLATRIPYGERLNRETLKKIDQGENYLRDIGFYNVRLRVHNQIVRIEVDPKDFFDLLNHRAEVISMLKTLGFTYITLDIEGFRSGSMDLV